MELWKCDLKFEQCNAAKNIKSVLQEYSKIINDKTEQNEYTLSKKICELVNNKLFNSNYTDIQLLNDFFHLKYNHNTNDDAQQLNLFHQYLSDYENALFCDIQYCRGYKRYYRNREQLLNNIENKENENQNNS
eukprot:140245_1